MKKIYPLFVVERIWHNASASIWMPIPIVGGYSSFMQGSRIWFSTN